VPVVRREPERQQLLFRHGAARVVPEAVEELGLGVPLNLDWEFCGQPVGARSQSFLQSRDRDANAWLFSELGLASTLRPLTLPV
jgi:hypothetical protein